MDAKYFVMRLFLQQIYFLYKNHDPKIQYKKKYWVKLFAWYKNINSALVAISTLVKSNIGERCLINILMNISTHTLRDYLKLANIYRGNSSKEKINLVEMIVYGRITNTLDKNKIEDISIKEANKIIKENKIMLKSLPRDGNTELKKKDIVPCENRKLSIRVDA